ncbi:MAG: hypothetical protein J2O48_02705 [Solirubrobacterales bacterium]|nr:hypothetical protein [Solirubrobacterales bacterium]
MPQDRQAEFVTSDYAAVDVLRGKAFQPMMSLSSLGDRPATDELSALMNQLTELERLAAEREIGQAIEFCPVNSSGSPIPDEEDFVVSIDPFSHRWALAHGNLGRFWESTNGSGDE